MPAAWKNSAICGASGAPPDTANRSLPPSAWWSFAKTSRWASLRLSASAAGTGRPARRGRGGGVRGRLDDALGQARRAGGVDDGRDVLGPGRADAFGERAREPVGVIAPEPPELRPGQHERGLALVAP